ncbi:porin OmpA [Citrobacter sedlakii]|uniref:porin OmpA n=1 Tax=Citrobacter sedlakii TaxID=67826 RepID=UPI001BAA8FC4|nr:porin OmpA [Citrobacter sedlakii]EKJ8220766.1 porin OmpA [Citrobacter sedlakii]QUC29236.1 porin OmpA [Citrobacter sedlakii]
MKKTVIALIVANAFSATSAFAAADAGTWYGGAKFGWSHYFDAKTGAKAVENNNDSNHFNIDRDNVGGGIYTGYQITPWLAVEGGYDYLGNMQIAGQHGGSGAKLKAQGLQMSLKASYAVTNNWDVYGRAGAMGYRAESDVSGHNRFETGVRPLAAVGTEYAFNKSWAGRVEYQWVSNVGNANQIGVSSDVSSVTAGVTYRFGQHDDAPAVTVPVVAPAPAPEPRHFNLKSDVMFDYNSATLTAEGQSAIRQLYNSPGLQPAKDKSTVVVGYSDRTGSEGYNQELSARRAQTVADALMTLGIPAQNIRAEGRGESESVTGAQCDGKQGQTLINCLSPDRRVVVEISDT